MKNFGISPFFFASAAKCFSCCITRRWLFCRLESEEIWKTLESTERAVAERFSEAMTSSIASVEIPTDACSREDSESGNACNFKSKINVNELYDFYLGVSFPQNIS